MNAAIAPTPGEYDDRNNAQKPNLQEFKADVRPLDLPETEVEPRSAKKAFSELSTTLASREAELRQSGRILGIEQYQLIGFEISGQKEPAIPAALLNSVYENRDRSSLVLIDFVSPSKLIEQLRALAQKALPAATFQEKATDLELASEAKEKGDDPENNVQLDFENDRNVLGPTFYTNIERIQSQISDLDSAQTRGARWASVSMSALHSSHSERLPIATGLQAQNTPMFNVDSTQKTSTSEKILLSDDIGDASGNKRSVGKEKPRRYEVTDQPTLMVGSSLCGDLDYMIVSFYPLDDKHFGVYLIPRREKEHYT